MAAGLPISQHGQAEAKLGHAGACCAAGGRGWAARVPTVCVQPVLDGSPAAIRGDTVLKARAGTALVQAAAQQLQVHELWLGQSVCVGEPSVCSGRCSRHRSGTTAACLTAHNPGHPPNVCRYHACKMIVRMEGPPERGGVVQISEAAQYALSRMFPNPKGLDHTGNKLNNW